MRPWFAALLLVLLLAPAAQAADPPASPFRLVALRDSVFALYGRGGNIGFFVGPKWVVMIDDQFQDLAPGIKRQIESVTSKPIHFLINTHHHGDHTGGNSFFAQFTEVIAQDQVRAHLLEGPKEILREYPADIDTLRTQMAAAKDTAEAGRLRGQIARMEQRLDWARTVKIEELVPFLTFSGEMRIHMGDEMLRLIHVSPAHTDGDCAVIFTKAHVVHMGDVFFNRTLPVIDVAHGASVPGYLTFIDEMLKQAPADATFIPGHGQVSDAAGLREFRGYIADLLDAVRKERAAGHTLAEAKQNIKLEKYKEWDGYAGRFAGNIEAAWETGGK